MARRVGCFSHSRGISFSKVPAGPLPRLQYTGPKTWDQDLKFMTSAAAPPAPVLARMADYGIEVSALAKNEMTMTVVGSCIRRIFEFYELIQSGGR